MGPLYTKKSEFRAEFHNVVNHVLTVDEIEEGWHLVLEKCRLWTHPYISRLFESGHKWAKSYFKGMLCAKMASTQSSESTNHMLKNYVPPGCWMHMFVKKYMRLQFDHVFDENYEVKRTRIGRPLMR